MSIFGLVCLSLEISLVHRAISFRSSVLSTDRATPGFELGSHFPESLHTQSGDRRDLGGRVIGRPDGRDEWFPGTLHPSASENFPPAE